MFVFVIVCGRWVNHTGVTNTWQRDVISAQCEGVQKQHQLLSKVGSLIRNVFLLTAVCLCTLVLVSWSLQAAAVLSPLNTNKAIWWALNYKCGFFQRCLPLACLHYSLQVGHGLHPSNESVILHWAGQFPGQVWLFYGIYTPLAVTSRHMIEIIMRLFVHPGAPHWLLNRLGLSRRI